MIAERDVRDKLADGRSERNTTLTEPNMYRIVGKRGRSVSNKR